MKGGVFHIPSYAAERECLVPASPRFFTTTSVGYTFDPEAPEPTTWWRFLESLWGDDFESIATLREFSATVSRAIPVCKSCC